MKNQEDKYDPNNIDKKAIDLFYSITEYCIKTKDYSLVPTIAELYKALM